MCDCDDDEHEPLDSDEIRHAADLVRAVYRFHGAGGNLHIVIDDGNIEAASIRWCVEDWMGDASNTEPGSTRQQLAERKCAAALLNLSEDERQAAIGLAHQQMREEERR